MKCLCNTNFVREVQGNLQGLNFFVRVTKLHYTAYIYSDYVRLSKDSYFVPFFQKKLVLIMSSCLQLKIFLIQLMSAYKL
jgi:hypothetical protein